MFDILYVFLILLYSVSVLFLMADSAEISYRFGIFAHRFLMIGGILHVIIFVGKTLQQGYFPLLTLFEILFFYSLILILLSIFIHYFFRWKLLEMIIIFLGLLTLIGAISTGETFPAISNTLLSNMAFLHISLSLVSYLAFSLSAIISILYLVYDSMLKKKVWNKFLKTLPSLEGLERNSFYANLVGVVLLFMGLIIGLVWASFFYDWRLLFDPKVLISIILLYMYGLAIMKRQKKSWLTKQLAIWNIISFVMVIINFTVTYVLDSFHNWL